jgi:flagellar hook-associated protein 2
MASPIQATGVGSNLDVSGIVNKLIEAEKAAPAASLTKRETAATVQISGFASFRGSLAAFQGTLVSLEETSNYTAVKASVGDSAIASANSQAGADPGSHTLEVTNLAVAQRLKSGTAFQSLTDVVGTGTISIQYGAQNGTTFTPNDKRATQTITIDGSHNTLTGVRDAINAAKVGVTASIVNDGTGFRLVLASKDSGTENSLKISVADDDGNPTDTAGLSQFAYDPSVTTGPGKNLEQVAAAEDAIFKLDGIEIKKSSNTVSDVLAGTTLTLLKENTGTPTTLNVSQDTSLVGKSVDAFVKAYNDLNKTITDLTKYDPATKTAGALQGDSSIRSISAQIRDGLSAMVSGVSGGYKALAQVGITMDKNGALSVDTGKLQTAMQNDPGAVQALFATRGYGADSLVKYNKASSTTPAGSYGVNISQLATQGRAVGSHAAALTIGAGSDALSLSIDGTTSTVSLTQKTYASAAELAAELQAKINGSAAFSGAGISTNVTESNGVLTVTSARYGSTSKVQLLGGTAQANLFGSAPTDVGGGDVAGTIGGVLALGSGKDLLSPNGLSVRIDGGNTGDRGNVHYTRGIAVALDDLIGRAIGAKGLIAARTDSLNAQVKDITEERTRLEAQLTAKQARYTKQFSTLDELLTNMQSTMSYLSQQLSALNSK